jgi:hypothetical protein
MAVCQQLGLMLLLLHLLSPIAPTAPIVVQIAEVVYCVLSVCASAWVPMAGFIFLDCEWRDWLWLHCLCVCMCLRQMDPKVQGLLLRGTRVAA